MSKIYKKNSPEFLIAYAEILKKHNSNVLKVNGMWEWRFGSCNNWESCSYYVIALPFGAWHSHTIFRLKPKTITINGIEYPAPMRDVPDVGGYCFVLGESGVKKYKWASEAADIYSPLATGRAFETEENAQQVFDALTKVLTGEA